MGIVVFEEISFDGVLLRSQRSAVVGRVALYATDCEIIWVNGYGAVIKHGMMIRAQNYHIGLDIGSLMRVTQRPEVMTFGISDPSWQSEREATNLTAGLVKGLQEPA